MFYEEGYDQYLASIGRTRQALDGITATPFRRSSDSCEGRGSQMRRRFALTTSRHSPGTLSSGDTRARRSRAT